MSTLQEKHVRAQSAHINGLYDEAIVLYTEILQADPENYNVLVHRAIAFTLNNNLESAIKDCELAILSDKTRHEAFYRRGVAYFNSGKVNPAQIDFDEALTKAKENAVKQQLNIWIAKCKVERGNKQFKDVQVTVAASSQAAEKKVTEVPVAQASENGKIVYKWYQTNAKVGIEIKYALDNREKIAQTATERHFEISFPIGDGRDYSLSLDLFDDIIPENTIINVNLTNIEVFLEKKNKTQNWKSLEAQVESAEVAQNKPLPVHDSQPKPLNVLPNQAPSYPSSSKVKRDWSKLDKEIEQELKKDGGEDPLNTIFKQIYDSGDENMKKAMVKSMQTSGGTVLSTNWDEVKEKDYTGKNRPDPPQGQEWRKWEK